MARKYKYDAEDLLKLDWRTFKRYTAGQRFKKAGFNIKEYDPWLQGSKEDRQIAKFNRISLGLEGPNKKSDSSAAEAEARNELGLPSSTAPTNPAAKQNEAAPGVKTLDQLKKDNGISLNLGGGVPVAAAGLGSLGIGKSLLQLWESLNKNPANSSAVEPTTEAPSPLGSAKNKITGSPTTTKEEESKLKAYQTQKTKNKNQTNQLAYMNLSTGKKTGGMAMPKMDAALVAKAIEDPSLTDEERQYLIKKANKTGIAPTGEMLWKGGKLLNMVFGGAMSPIAMGTALRRVKAETGESGDSWAKKAVAYNKAMAEKGVEGEHGVIEPEVIEFTRNVLNRGGAKKENDWGYFGNEERTVVPPLSVLKELGRREKATFRSIVPETPQDVIDTMRWQRNEKGKEGQERSLGTVNQFLKGAGWVAKTNKKAEGGSMKNRFEPSDLNRFARGSTGTAIEIFADPVNYLDFAPGVGAKGGNLIDEGIRMGKTKAGAGEAANVITDVAGEVAKHGDSKGLGLLKGARVKKGTNPSKIADNLLDMLDSVDAGTASPKVTDNWNSMPELIQTQMRDYAQRVKDARAAVAANAAQTNGLEGTLRSAIDNSRNAETGVPTHNLSEALDYLNRKTGDMEEARRLIDTPYNQLTGEEADWVWEANQQAAKDASLLNIKVPFTDEGMNLPGGRALYKSTKDAWNTAGLRNVGRQVRGEFPLTKELPFVGSKTRQMESITGNKIAGEVLQESLKRATGAKRSLEGAALAEEHEYARALAEVLGKDLPESEKSKLMGMVGVALSGNKKLRNITARQLTKQGTAMNEDTGLEEPVNLVDEYLRKPAKSEVSVIPNKKAVAIEKEANDFVMRPEAVGDWGRGQGSAFDSGQAVDIHAALKERIANSKPGKAFLTTDERGLQPTKSAYVLSHYPGRETVIKSTPDVPPAPGAIVDFLDKNADKLAEDENYFGIYYSTDMQGWVMDVSSAIPDNAIAKEDLPEFLKLGGQERAVHLDADGNVEFISSGLSRKGGAPYQTPEQMLLSEGQRTNELTQLRNMSGYNVKGGRNLRSVEGAEMPTPRIDEVGEIPKVAPQEAEIVALPADPRYKTANDPVQLENMYERARTAIDDYYQDWGDGYDVAGHDVGTHGGVEQYADDELLDYTFGKGMYAEINPQVDEGGLRAIFQGPHDMDGTYNPAGRKYGGIGYTNVTGSQGGARVQEFGTGDLNASTIPQGHQQLILANAYVKAMVDEGMTTEEAMVAFFRDSDYAKRYLGDIQVAMDTAYNDPDATVRGLVDVFKRLDIDFQNGGQTVAKVPVKVHTYKGRGMFNGAGFGSKFLNATKQSMTDVVQGKAPVMPKGFGGLAPYDPLDLSRTTIGWENSPRVGQEGYQFGIHGAVASNAGQGDVVPYHFYNKSADLYPTYVGYDQSFDNEIDNGVRQIQGAIDFAKADQEAGARIQPVYSAAANDPQRGEQILVDIPSDRFVHRVQSLDELTPESIAQMAKRYATPMQHDMSYVPYLRRLDDGSWEVRLGSAMSKDDFDVAKQMWRDYRSPMMATFDNGGNVRNVYGYSSNAASEPEAAKLLNDLVEGRVPGQSLMDDPMETINVLGREREIPMERGIRYNPDQPYGNLDAPQFEWVRGKTPEIAAESSDGKVRLVYQNKHVINEEILPDGTPNYIITDSRGNRVTTKEFGSREDAQAFADAIALSPENQNRVAIETIDPETKEFVRQPFVFENTEEAIAKLPTTLQYVGAEDVITGSPIKVGSNYRSSDPMIKPFVEGMEGQKIATDKSGTPIFRDMEGEVKSWRDVQKKAIDLLPPNEATTYRSSFDVDSAVEYVQQMANLPAMQEQGLFRSLATRLLGKETAAVLDEPRVRSAVELTIDLLSNKNTQGAADAIGSGHGWTSTMGNATDIPHMPPTIARSKAEADFWARLGVDVPESGFLNQQRTQFLSSQIGEQPYERQKTFNTLLQRRQEGFPTEPDAGISATMRQTKESEILEAERTNVQIGTASGARPAIKKGSSWVFADTGRALTDAEESRMVSALGQYAWVPDNRQQAQQLQQLITDRGYLKANPKTEVTKALDQGAASLIPFMTVFRPAFMAVNELGNIANMLVTGKLDPQSFVDATKIMYSVFKEGGGSYKGVKGVTKLGSREVPTEQLVKELMDMGAISPLEINPSTMYRETGDSFLYTAPYIGKYLKSAREMNSFLENQAHLSIILHELKKGTTVGDAKRIAKDTLYEYDIVDLTKTEQLIRRYLPFYTFWRRNLPFQAKMLLTRPMYLNTLTKMLEAIDEGENGSSWYGTQQQLSDFQQQQGLSAKTNLPFFGESNVRVRVPGADMMSTMAGVSKIGAGMMGNPMEGDIAGGIQQSVGEMVNPAQSFGMDLLTNNTQDGMQPMSTSEDLLYSLSAAAPILGSLLAAQRKEKKSPIAGGDTQALERFFLNQLSPMPTSDWNSPSMKQQKVYEEDEKLKNALSWYKKNKMIVPNAKQIPW